MWFPIVGAPNKFSCLDQRKIRTRINWHPEIYKSQLASSESNTFTTLVFQYRCNPYALQGIRYSNSMLNGSRLLQQQATISFEYRWITKKWQQKIAHDFIPSNFRGYSNKTQLEENSDELLLGFLMITMFSYNNTTIRFNVSSFCIYFMLNNKIAVRNKTKYKMPE